MRWLRMQWFSLSAGLKLWLDEPMGHFFNALVLAVALALPWTLVQSLNALVPSMDRWVGDPEISLYFKPNAAKSSVDDAAALLKRDFDFGDVRVVTPEQALLALREQSQTPDLAASLPNNPLPYTIVLSLNVDSNTNTQALEQKIKEWGKFKEVEHVQYDAQWVRRLQSMLNGAVLIAWALALLIAGTVLVVTFNTVRLQLIRNQTEIHVLKAMGSTDSEVGRPTLWWSISLACLAFMLAWIFTMGSMSLADDAAGQLIREFDRGFAFEAPPTWETVLLFPAWILLVAGGAWASVKVTVLRIH